MGLRLFSTKSDVSDVQQENKNDAGSPPALEAGERGNGDEGGADDLHRGMKPRQLNMMAIAGAIGTGLIIGTGSALRNGGPASLLIGYSIMGFIVYIVMVALGEMGAFLPHKKAFSGYASRFVDPAMGFATGWNYFFKYAIVLPNNLTATGLIIQYWLPDLNVSVWIVVFGILIIALNLIHVRFFGEAEFWMSLVKALVIVMVIIVCLVLALGGGPNHQRTGFWYWTDPGAFAQYSDIPGAKGRFLAVWASLVQATFAYLGTELVGVAFGETPNPRRNVPRAVNQTLFRIVLFYVVGVLVLGMAVKYNDPRLLDAIKTGGVSAAASPFVIAALNGGITGLDHAINALLLVFTVSAANSDVYLASRTLWALAKDHQAPHYFHRTNKYGVPLASVALSAVFIALGFMNAAEDASSVFGYFVALVTTFGAWNWIAVLVSYLAMIRGMKAQNMPRETMPYRNPLLPGGAYVALAVTILIVIFQGVGNGAFVPKFSASKFVTSYLGVAIFLLNIAWWKVFKGTKRVRPEDMDLTTGRRTWDEE